MSSHNLLTLFYTIGALEPSECHLADGWGLAKRGKGVGCCTGSKTYY